MNFEEYEINMKRICKASTRIYIIGLSISIVDRPGKWDSSGRNNTQCSRRKIRTAQGGTIHSVSLKNLQNRPEPGGKKSK